MTEIQLEDSAFVLFSRLVNLFEDPYSEFRWTDAIEVRCNNKIYPLGFRVEGLGFRV